MKIAVDAMGGDYAPLEIVFGAVRAAKKFGCEIVRVRGNKYFAWVKTRNDEREVFRAKFIMVSWGEEQKGGKA